VGMIPDNNSYARQKSLLAAMATWATALRLE